MDFKNIFLQMLPYFVFLFLSFMINLCREAGCGDEDISYTVPALLSSAILFSATLYFIFVAENENRNKHSKFKKIDSVMRANFLASSVACSLLSYFYLEQTIFVQMSYVVNFMIIIYYL